MSLLKILILQCELKIHVSHRSDLQGEGKPVSTVETTDSLTQHLLSMTLPSVLCVCGCVLWIISLCSTSESCADVYWSVHATCVCLRKSLSGYTDGKGDVYSTFQTQMRFQVVSTKQRKMHLRYLETLVRNWKLK